jgi:general L-amino acid transport system permease protein
VTERVHQPDHAAQIVRVWRACWSNPTLRAAVVQAIFLIGLGFFLVAAIMDVRANMHARGIPTDFSFLNNVAGFDINQTLIPYSPLSSYGRAFLVGLLNTCLVASISLVLATLIGFWVGIARLSKNAIVAWLAMAYVEGFRNVPVLLQLLFWYNAILKPLPGPRQSVALPFGVFLNNRGLFVPEPVLGPGIQWICVAIAFSIVAAILCRRFLPRGEKNPLLPGVAACLIVLPPILAFVMVGQPVSFVFPELHGFNFTGGLRLVPEFVALVLGLSLYTAAFIAEIVRAGLTSVPRGQREAAAALGLSRRMALGLILIPQAMRVIVPLLTSQYLNLVKNSSLAVFIGYPDLVQVFAGTVLNQTGAAVQIIFITMAVYLAISLLISLAMNLYDRRLVPVGR